MAEARRIGWIGLGKLGLPMASRVVAAGHHVTGHDPDASRVALAAKAGLATASEANSIVAEAPIVFTSLPDDDALIDAFTSPGGLLAHAVPGTIFVETSTVSAGASACVATAASAVRYLRAPVSGNPVLAERGELTLLASGDRSAFEQAREAIVTFTRTQHYLGAGEEARYAKLALNLMIAVSAGMMAEALALARKGGVDWSQMLDLLADSAVGSPMVRYKVPPLKARDYASTFSCRQMAKDLDLILTTSRGAGVPAPLAALMRETYAALISTGEGEADFIATVRQAERLSGLA